MSSCKAPSSRSGEYLSYEEKFILLWKMSSWIFPESMIKQRFYNTAGPSQLAGAKNVKRSLIIIIEITFEFYNYIRYVSCPFFLLDKSIRSVDWPNSSVIGEELKDWFWIFKVQLSRWLRKDTHLELSKSLNTF